MSNCSRFTLDCEIDFSRFFDGQAELRSRCHRLNIVLPDKPCKLDEVDTLEELEHAALDFLNPQCRQAYGPNFRKCSQSHSARRFETTGKLFYFDVTEIQPNGATNPRDWRVDWLLRCRLKRQYRREFLRVLEVYLSTGSTIMRSHPNMIHLYETPCDY